MQDSLLSRFDLLFIVLDQMEPENDRRISDHVLRIHRYRSPNEQDGDRKHIDSLLVMYTIYSSISLFLFQLFPPTSEQRLYQLKIQMNQSKKKKIHRYLKSITIFCTVKIQDERDLQGKNNCHFS